MGSAKKSKIPPKKKPARSVRKKRSGGGAPLDAAAVQSLAVAKPKNPNAVYFLLLGLALTAAGTFSLPNFRMFLPPQGVLAQALVHPTLLLIGFLCLAFAFHQLPEDLGPAEMRRGTAYVGFVFFFGLCFFWRFVHPLQPSAPFWFDNQVVTADIVNIIDSHQNYLLFPWGQREPGFPYLTAALWEFFPHAGGVWIVRLSCTVIDLAAIWGLYLLGSAIRGRRMGLILMALWAVSLPMTIWNYFGMGQNTAALAAIWVLLFFYRLVQKPTLARFIYWGIALGFGAYCYVPFRPWTPAMISIVLLWVLFGSQEKPKGWGPWALAAGLWVSWAFLFFYKNNFIPSDNALVLLAVRPWFLGGLAVLLLSAYVKTWTEIGENETHRRIFGWATGAATTALLMSPLLLHPLYSSHTSDSSAFHQGGKFEPNGEAFRVLWHNVVFFFEAMFLQPREDVSRYPIGGSSYFEVFPEMAMVVGLAYFAARPAWKKSVVILMTLVGACSFILSNHPHTGRVETTVPPLLLLGAWGLDYFWGVVSRETKDRFIRLVVLLFLVGIWVWDSQRTFTVCRDWMAFKSNDAVIGEQLDKDWEKYRVIISVHYPEFATPALTVLCDQKEAYTLNDPNPIYLEPGGKGKDIVFLMYGSTRFDKPIEDRVRAEFPQAQWSVIECPNPDIPRFMLRAVIPMDSLSESPGKLFYVQRVPHDYWRRRFYWKDYGIARGMVWWDDRVPSWKADFPPGVNEYMSARIDGEITVSTEGDYVFSVPPTLDVNVLSIDDKTLIDLKPQNSSPSAAGKIYLKPGAHRVSFVTTFRRVFKLGEIRVTPPGGAPEWILGQPPLDSKP